MKPLIFVLVVLGLSIMISLRLSEEVTWFTYYKGGVAGLLVSGVLLEVWVRRRRARELEKRRR